MSGVDYGARVASERREGTGAECHWPFSSGSLFVYSVCSNFSKNPENEEVLKMKNVVVDSKIKSVIRRKLLYN